SHCGGLEFIWNEDYSLRYTYCFPIDSTAWKKIVVPWRDLISSMPSAALIAPANGNAPSKLGGISFGKWWFWRDFAACSYAIDEIRLEPAIPVDNNEYK